MSVAGQSRISALIWSYAQILRDAGLSYTEYLEQITFLLFLKLSNVEDQNGILAWSKLVESDKDQILLEYDSMLNNFSKRKGIVGDIFNSATNKVSSPDLLEMLVSLIDQEDWQSYDSYTKGRIYEDLVSRNAEDVRGGAGQYFTPRALVKVIVDCIDPKPEESIHDPACGTGGFLLTAHDYIRDTYNNIYSKRKAAHKIKITGTEIVPSVFKLATMNMILNDISHSRNPIANEDALNNPKSECFDVVFANPPFGKRSNVTYTNHSGKNRTRGTNTKRTDFLFETNSKQLAFLQHILLSLKINGRAAVIVPDSILFEKGASEQFRRYLLKEGYIHTILKLPMGVFYANGVKANVLFIRKSENGSRSVWIYDGRTDIKVSPKSRPLSYKHLEEFVYLYSNRVEGKNDSHSRFREFKINDLLSTSDARLDISWIQNIQTHAPHSSEILDTALNNLKLALSSLENLISK